MLRPTGTITSFFRTRKTMPKSYNVDPQETCFRVFGSWCWTSSFEICELFCSTLSNQLAKNFILKAYPSCSTCHQRRRHHNNRFDQHLANLLGDNLVDLKEREEANDSFDVKSLHENVSQIFSLESKMLNNSDAFSIEFSHTPLDIFERPELQINFDRCFMQKTVPLFAPNETTLEFEVKGERTNFIDLQILYLEVKCKNVKADNTSLKLS